MTGERQHTLDGQSCKALLYLGNRIDTLSVGGAKITLIFSFLIIAILGRVLHPIGLHIVPLYLIPVCLASWRLGMRSGLLSVLVAAISSVAVHGSDGRIEWIEFSNLALQLITLPILAGIVSSFRCSFDREHFLARNDGTTGALNRLAFEKEAKRVIATGAREGHPIVMMYVDLDGFKAINDRFGHDAGDQVLQSFGAAGRSMIRASDCFGRMGGDEFAIAMPLKHNEDGVTVAQRVHAHLTAALSESGYSATCSMGALIVHPDRRTSMKDVMCYVDKLMYSVKHNGKDGFQFSSFSSFGEGSSLHRSVGIDTAEAWSCSPRPEPLKSLQ